MTALILSCGGSPEPLIFCVESIKPEFIYFLCSSKSVDKADVVIDNFKLEDGDYKIKIVENYESLEDCFAISREIIQELQKDYDDIHVDFTGGTKPMIAGLVLAAIGEDCTYSYIGSDDLSGRDKDGLGVVQNGFESIKNQRDPYDVFAVMEFTRGMELFNQYQFKASKLNFQLAGEKLESETLKELAKVYLEIVEVYDLWDKFKNVKGKKLTLNVLLARILDKIKASKNLFNHINENYPKFIFQIENNIEFLNLKLSSKGRIKPKNVIYYLPDLLNNAYRRIEEGKYDDAVARLYRAIELIAQSCLTNENVVNEDNLWKNAEFSINIFDVDSKNDVNVDEVLNTFGGYVKSKEKNKNTFRIALKDSYCLLRSFGLDFADDYLKDDNIKENITLRNRSILAHGLQPIDDKKANELYAQVLSYSKRAFPELVKYMDMAEFPKFE